jgi:ATP-binding cassette subfamily B protein
MNQDENNQEQSERATMTAVSLYSRLWLLLKPDIAGNGLRFSVAYLMALGSIGASFCAPWFLSAMLDTALPNGDTGLFYRYAAAIIISLAVFFFFSLLKTIFLTKASERIFCSLRTRLVATLLKKPMRFYSKFDTGDLITRVSNDTEHLSLLVFDYVYASLYGLTLIFLFVALMLVWEWRMGLYTALSLPCYLLLLYFMQKPLCMAANMAREKFSLQNDTMLDILAGVKEIRFYQQFQSTNRRFSDAANLFTTANIRSVLIGECAFNSLELFARLIAMFPFLLGGYWICHRSTSISIGTLIAYNLYMTYIASSLEVVNVGLTKLTQAAPLITRIQEVIAFKEEVADESNNTGDSPDSTRLEFRDVCLSHDGNKKVLKDFCLAIEPGEKVAIMGPSGSGKSTLIDLLTRQLRADSGQVLFGGQPVSDYSLPLYLMHFGYVRQHPYLFRTTARENIATGWYDIPLDVIIAAAERVRIHDTIIGLPNGYDTIIGRDGIELSGGQQQRIALARALVRDPAILLLDEFTSALDRATEEEILDDLFTSVHEQTIICVTHSPSVASRFDRIVRLVKV